MPQGHLPKRQAQWKTVLTGHPGHVQKAPHLACLQGAEPTPLGLHRRPDARTTKESEFYRRKTFKRLAPRASYAYTAVQAAACALAGACLALSIFSPSRKRIPFPRYLNISEESFPLF